MMSKDIPPQTLQHSTTKSRSNQDLWPRAYKRDKQMSTPALNRERAHASKPSKYGLHPNSRCTTKENPNSLHRVNTQFWPFRHLNWINTPRISRQDMHNFMKFPGKMLYVKVQVLAFPKETVWRANSTANLIDW